MLLKLHQSIVKFIIDCTFRVSSFKNRRNLVFKYMYSMLDNLYGYIFYQVFFKFIILKEDWFVLGK